MIIISKWVDKDTFKKELTNFQLVFNTLVSGTWYGPGTDLVQTWQGPNIGTEKGKSRAVLPDKTEG